MKMRTVWCTGLAALTLTISIWAQPHKQAATAPEAKDHATAVKQEPFTYPSTPDAKNVHTELMDAKNKATAEGKVVCCISPPCDFCIAHMAMCQCRKNISVRKPVCRECAGGWAVGEGHVAHVNPRSVKGMTRKQMLKTIRDTAKTQSKTASK